MPRGLPTRVAIPSGQVARWTSRAPRTRRRSRSVSECTPATCTFRRTSRSTAVPVPAPSQRALPERRASMRSAGSQPATRSVRRQRSGSSRVGGRSSASTSASAGSPELGSSTWPCHPRADLDEEQARPGRCRAADRVRGPGVAGAEQLLHRGAEDAGQRERGLDRGLGVAPLDGVERLTAHAGTPRELSPATSPAAAGAHGACSGDGRASRAASAPRRAAMSSRLDPRVTNTS